MHSAVVAVLVDEGKISRKYEIGVVPGNAAQVMLAAPWSEFLEPLKAGNVPKTLKAHPQYMYWWLHGGYTVAK